MSKTNLLPVSSDPIPEYFYAKFGTGNALLTKYLSNETEVKGPAVPIFFAGIDNNHREIERCEDLIEAVRRKQKPQVQSFFECGRNTAHKYIVAIGNGRVRVLAPTAEAVFCCASKETLDLKEQAERDASEFEERYRGKIKLLPVEICVDVPASTAPVVLSGMTQNRYISANTFVKFPDGPQYRGNIKAVEFLLATKAKNRSIRNEQFIADPKQNNPSNLLECLSSIELETLVAKLFENYGCFVPAYKGGTIKDIDLFVHNDKDIDINISGLIVPKNESKSIQVKRNDPDRPPQFVDFLTVLGGTSSGSRFGANWFASSLNDDKGKAVKEWMERSLSWLAYRGNDYLKNNWPQFKSV